MLWEQCSFKNIFMYKKIIITVFFAFIFLTSVQLSAQSKNNYAKTPLTSKNTVNPTVSKSINDTLSNKNNNDSVYTKSSNDKYTKRIIVKKEDQKPDAKANSDSANVQSSNEKFRKKLPLPK